MLNSTQGHVDPVLMGSEKLTHLASPAWTRSLGTGRSRRCLQHMRATGSHTDGLR